MGMVIIACAPPFLLLATKSSAVAPGVGSVGDAFKIPVGGVIVRVELPVVARLGVAAGTVQGDIQVRQLVRGGKGHAINQRADRVAVGLRVDRDGDGALVPLVTDIGHQRNVVQIKRRLRRPCDPESEARKVGWFATPRADKGT